MAKICANTTTTTTNNNNNSGNTSEPPEQVNRPRDQPELKK